MKHFDDYSSSDIQSALQSVGMRKTPHNFPAVETAQKILSKCRLSNAKKLQKTQELHVKPYRP